VAKKREKRDQLDELDELDKPTCEGYGPDPERKYLDPWADDHERRKKPRRRPTARHGRRGRSG
jgi:hypothetical protein